MNKFYTFILFLFFLCPYSNAQYSGDQIFDESYIHEIQITTDISLDSLYDIFSDNFFSGDFTYTKADIVIDGNALDSIGVRIKGGVTAFQSKKPLKLDFNEFVSGRKYDGLKKLNIHPGDRDTSLMREALSYGLMRNAGVKTARTSFAKIFFNGNFLGIYTLVEQIDNDFIHNRFASNEGALYKTSGGSSTGLVVKYEINNPLPYPDFVTAVSQIPNNLLHEQLPDYLDVESFLRFIATEIFVNNVDGPLTTNYNYNLYYEPKSATYVYIPWDYNLSLYGYSNHQILENSENFIFEKVKENPILKERYLNIFCELLQYNFDENRILNQINTYRDLLEDEAGSDPHIDSVEHFYAVVTYVENVISDRVQNLTNQMNNEFTPCSPLVNPIQSLDIVINEIVASNDSTSGIVDLAGGAADWIELYNNTSTNISLNGFYLSNDKDVLKHWRFPVDTMIAANDYLIIWADRDIDEEGLHTDFKLNKNLGEVYLSFENGEIIDELNYEEQMTNLGLARVPNGTGPFMMQTSTFNITNEIIISVNDKSTESILEIFPNPAKASTMLNVSCDNNTSTSIQIFNMQGILVWGNEQQLIQGENQVPISLSRLDAGMYCFVLIDKGTNEKWVERLVVME